VLRFTHEDTFKPLAGYQVAVSHFHTHFGEQLSDAGTLNLQPPGRLSLARSQSTSP